MDLWLLDSGRQVDSERRERDHRLHTMREFMSKQLGQRARYENEPPLPRSALASRTGWSGAAATSTACATCKHAVRRAVSAVSTRHVPYPSAG